jgi:predicted Rdx family selenoprotein
MKHDVDTELITKLLRERGHTVGHIIPVPDKGGEFEFEVDGALLSLAETRLLLEREDEQT